MKISILASSLLCSLFWACDAPQNNSISESENMGLTEVAEVFGAQVRYKEIISVHSSEGKKRVFELKIDSLSTTMQNFKEHPFMLATNAAFLFYKNLAETEKDQLTHVHIILPYDNEGMDTYKCSVGLLDTLVSKMTIIEKAMVCIQNKNYKALFLMMDFEMDQTVQQKFMEGLKEDEGLIDDLTGKYLPLGFKFFQPSDEPMYGRFFALLLGNNRPLRLSIDFKLNPEVGKISGFRFAHKF